MQSRHFLILIILVTGLLFCACNRQKKYSHFEHVSETGWEKVDTIAFDIPPVTESGAYHEKLELRIDANFPYQSLTMEVTQTIFPDPCGRMSIPLYYHASSQPSDFCITKDFS